MSEETTGTMVINGKELKFRMDLGTLRVFQKKSQRNFFTLKEEEFGNPEVLHALLFAAASRGGKKVTEADIDSMTLGEVMEAQNLIEQAISSFLPEPDPDAEAEDEEEGKNVEGQDSQ